MIVVRPVLLNHFCVELVTGLEVSEDTNIRERISNRIQHKDTINQQRKDFIRESCVKTNDTDDIEHSIQDGVNEQPHRHPNIEGKEVHINGIGDLHDGASEGQDRTSGTNDSKGHTSNKTVRDPDP